MVFDMKILEGKAPITLGRRYQVKPMECWAKMKELRRSQVKELWAAKKEGRVLVLGLLDQMSSLPMGLGEVSIFTFGPYFGKIMDNPDLAAKCCEITEARGFGPDTCATLRIQLGSVYMGFHNKSRTGEAVIPDFCLEMHQCDAQSKVAREITEHYGIPFFAIECAPFPDAIDYLVAQMHDCIDWMQKVTKRPFDDEKFIQAVNTEWESRVWYARTCELLKTIPAPLDMRMLASFTACLFVAKPCRPQVAELMKLLYDETLDRVNNGVAALGFREKARLFHEGLFPQYAIGGWAPGALGRVVVDYGAIFLGARIQFAIQGAWKIHPDGSWTAAQTPAERGITLRTREDAVRSLADLYLTHGPQMQDWQLANRVTHELALVRQWNVDGVVLLLDRTCHGNTPSMLEIRHALSKTGIPSMTYEASSADPREFDRVKVVDALESFLESLGLTRSIPT